GGRPLAESYEDVDAATGTDDEHRRTRSERVWRREDRGIQYALIAARTVREDRRQRPLIQVHRQRVRPRSGEAIVDEERVLEGIAVVSGPAHVHSSERTPC